MAFLKRQWSDAEKWGMGIVSALVIAAMIGGVKYICIDGEVRVTIASDRDIYGRCLDRELFVINKSNTDALNIVISFDVDYFTRQGVVALEYGDEREELISSAMKTLLDRNPFVPVEHRMDYQHSKLTIPQLKPGEYLHLYYGGETILDNERAAVRTKSLHQGNRDLMDKPRVLSAVRKDGSVAISRGRDCEK